MRTWLKDKREELGFTQQQIAEKLGLSQQYYSLIEAGNRQQEINLPLVLKLSNLLNVSVDFIVQMETQNKSL